MDRPKDLKIQFSGLKEGIHEFTFELDESFLETMGAEEIGRCKFRHQVVLEKRTNMLVVEIESQGTLQTDCDRCAEEVEIPVEGSDRFFVKFGMDPSDDDQIEVLEEGAHTLDLQNRIYQLELLSIPLKKAHPEGECDPAVLAYLQEEESDEDQEIDPRWNALKDLNKNES